MKKLKPLYFIVLCILFQSCSSYKSVEYNDIRNNEEQKFRIVNKDQLKVKGKLVNKDDEKITLVTFDGKTLTIPKEEINELKNNRVFGNTGIRRYRDCCYYSSFSVNWIVVRFNYISNPINITLQKRKNEKVFY
jgi:hypothetical protein